MPQQWKTFSINLPIKRGPTSQDWRTQSLKNGYPTYKMIWFQTLSCHCTTWMLGSLVTNSVFVCFFITDINNLATIIPTTHNQFVRYHLKIKILLEKISSFLSLEDSQLTQPYYVFLLLYAAIHSSCMETICFHSISALPSKSNCQNQTNSIKDYSYANTHPTYNYF